MANYQMTVETGTGSDEILVAGLVAFNTQHAGTANRREFSILLRDGDGVIVGGLSAATPWNWLFIKLLWVSDAVRGQGWGRALMARAEQEAVTYGCANAYLDTFSFQARGFYERLGYEVFGQLDDFPPGHTRYFLQKRGLTAQGAGTNPAPRL